MTTRFIGQNVVSASTDLLGTQSPFDVKPIRAPNFIMEHEDFAPTAGGELAPGSVVTHEPARIFHRLRNCTYLIKTSAATSTGATGDFPRYMDYVGFYIVRQFNLLYGNTEIQQFNGKQLYRYHQHRARPADSLAGAVDGGLATDTAGRASNAQTAGHVILVPLYLLFFSNGIGNSFPYTNSIISQELRFRLTLAENNDIIETDGSDITHSYTSIQLRCEGATVGQSIQVKDVNDTLAVDPYFGTSGWTRLVKTQDTLSGQSVGAGTEQQTVSINSLTKTYSDIGLCVYTKAKSQNGVIKADITPHDFQEISSWGIRANNSSLVSQVDDKYGRQIKQNGYSRGASNEFLYRHSWSLAPDSNAQVGMMSLQGISPQIEYTMKADQGALSLLDIDVQNHNVVAIAGRQLRVLY